MKPVVDFLCSDPCLPRIPGTPGGAAHAISWWTASRLLGLEPAGTRIRPADPADRRIESPGPHPGEERSLRPVGGALRRVRHRQPGSGRQRCSSGHRAAVAEQLAKRSLDRSVIIALFDAEEPPYFLTQRWARSGSSTTPRFRLESIDTMICLDLVGHALGPTECPTAVRELGVRARSGEVHRHGAVLDGLPAVAGIAPRRIDNYIIGSMSDYDAFMNASIPFLFYTMGRSEHYHAPTDTPDRLDYDKMAAFAAHLTDLVTALANRPDTPVFMPDGFDDAATVGTITGAARRPRPLRAGSRDGAADRRRPRTATRSRWGPHQRRPPNDRHAGDAIGVEPGVRIMNPAGIETRHNERTE